MLTAKNDRFNHPRLSKTFILKIEPIFRKENFPNSHFRLSTSIIVLANASGKQCPVRIETKACDTRYIPQII